MVKITVNSHMSSCWWPITVHWSRTCYVMNDTKKVVCSLSTFIVEKLAGFFASSLQCWVVADVYAQANPWKQQWVNEREVIHGAARGRASERGSREEHSRLLSRDFPRLPQMESWLTGYKYSRTHIDYLVFSESVSTNDDLDCSTL